ncbi:uncharacterized protein LOC105165089 [Sesamum indicum]|uniref:Uncharacterized protein LOC105165089 n=1 Tax=Sesamum indicum TaxID=4182 RepID=A0A6I9TBT2_SESIN|nr:uncharacterized protein LOC105165089 [Sesamum indicum]
MGYLGHFCINPDSSSATVTYYYGGKFSPRLVGDKRYYKKVKTGFQLLTTDSQCLELGREYRHARDVPIYVEMFGDLVLMGADVNEDSERVRREEVVHVDEERGRRDDVNDVDEDEDLFDFDYDLSTEIDDDGILFDDYVDDKTTSDLPIDDGNNSEGLSGSSDDGEPDIMGDEIDLIENKISDDEQIESNYPIFNPVENFDPTFTLGMMFSTKGDLRKTIQSHAINTRRHIICTKSDPNRYYAKCGGDCDWKLHARKVKDECTFQIRDYNPKHKCAKTFNLKNVKSSWLCDKYLDKFKSGPKRAVKGFRVDAINEIRCHISKHQAYRAKRKALKKFEGGPEYQYTRLWDYADEIRRTNPGSTVIGHI